MSLKARLRKIEQRAPRHPFAKRPEDMSDDELDAEIEYENARLRMTATGRDFLARLEAAGEGKSPDEAMRAQIEFLEADLAKE